MSLSKIVKTWLDFLKSYIWLLTVFLFIQGTTYHSIYLSTLKVDEGYYPLSFEQVLSYAMVMYLKDFSLILIVVFFVSGLLAIFISNKLLFSLKVKLKTIKLKKSWKKNCSEEDLIKPIEVNKPNKIQEYGANILVIAYSLFVFLFLAIVPASIVAKIDAEELLQSADKQIDLMRKDSNEASSNIKIKCNSVEKLFP